MGWNDDIMMNAHWVVVCVHLLLVLLQMLVVCCCVSSKMAILAQSVITTMGSTYM